jgi:hypothetical protein
MGLTQDQIKALLGPDKSKPPQVHPPRHHVSTRNTKHVKWYDKEMRCSNKWGLKAIECGSPTYIRVNGLPLCMIHAILKLAEMLDPPLEGEL